ncbi:MAG TPA: regulatory iron-sulfur-containing complex subunit RicT [Dehalococcoidia bacterium]|nr:regulatory iron-sulfur-containing complex subunit RicT [Dehalococcoidia bacterium]
MATRTAGVRFRQAGKIFYYDALDFELEVGMYVVVESAHGLSCGRIVISPDQVIENQSSNQSDMKPILRIATPEDMDKMEAAREKAHESLRVAKALAAEQGLDMTLASGEYDLDGGQFTAYFSAQERVDFRGLVRDLSRDLDARVQLLQVGDRDRAKLVDGFDICGERLCCSSWMTSFPAVSIRMAKEQDLPLNPQKISGVCGRLYCCLTFEYEDYKELRGKLPKVGSVHSTPAGEAKVMGIDFNREIVKMMLTDTRTFFEVPALDFQLQNGVTIRPMELVRKIEGPLRTVLEDSSARTATPGAPAEGGRGRDAGRDRGGRRRRGRGAGGEAPAPYRSPAAPQPPPQPPAAQQPSGDSTEGGESAQKRRRRRRRRGRGGGAPGEAGPSPPAGD